MAKKKVSRKAKKAAKTKASAKPGKFQVVTPYLTINGAAEAIEWYSKVFGANEKNRAPTPDGKIMHAEIRIGNTAVFLSDLFEWSGSKDPKTLEDTGVALHIISPKVDELWKNALAAGAKVEMELDDQFWGDRFGQLRDPFGHFWSLSWKSKLSKEELKKKETEAMRMFAGGEGPGKQ
jgi:uncharacterized glyoxalase superfamily protein PhnB